VTPVMTIQSTARVLRTLRTLRQTKNQGAHLRNIVANPEWPRRVFAGTALLMDATNVASRLKRNGNALASSSASVYPRSVEGGGHGNKSKWIEESFRPSYRLSPDGDCDPGGGRVRDSRRYASVILMAHVSRRRIAFRHRRVDLRLWILCGRQMENHQGRRGSNVLPTTSDGYPRFRDARKSIGGSDALRVVPRW
jgi:hypothetical protein